MTGTPTPALDDRGAALGGLRLRRVQFVYAIVVVLVLLAFVVVDPGIWLEPSVWIATGGTAVATGLSALIGTDRGERWRLQVAVPSLDLLALIALIASDQAPRVLVLLAVVPSFWLGITAQRWGIGLVVGASLVISTLLALRIPTSTGVTLTANTVGTVLVPLALVATAWFAHTYTRTIERQQSAILQREREKLAIARQREADAALLDAIFETARVGLLLLDPDGGLVRANSTLTGHQALGGAALGDLLDGARYLELDGRREIPSTETPLVRAARGEAFDNVVCWVARAGHDMFAVTMSSRPLFLDGEFRGSIASIDDVTAYMRMVEDRDDFVALVSHELRTPLTSITGYLELVLDEELPDELRSWLGVVQRNADRLRALVEDLLIVGEISRGEVRLETQRVDLRALALDATTALQHRTRSRDLTLTLAEGPPVMVDVDPRRITQVIENLVSNGIKYTRDHGRVDVTVAVEGTAEGADAVVRVVDDGQGVPPEEALRVFERFYRSAEARASGVQGAGLGLWICRMIVEEHGGMIAFESTRGEGSIASFRLPVAS